MALQFHEPESPFGMLMSGVQGAQGIQDFFQQSRLNPIQLALAKYKQQYAPREAEADIFHKTLMPLANLSISPLMMAMNPEQQQQISALISKVLQNYQVGKSGQPGILGEEPRYSNREEKNNGLNFPFLQSNNSISAGTTNAPFTTQNNAPGLLPQGGQGLRGGAITKATAPYQSQPYGKGEVVENPKTGEYISTPTESSISQAQQSSAAIKAVKPIIERLAEEAKPFLSKGGRLKTLGSQVGTELSKWGVPEMITNFLPGPELGRQRASFLSSVANSVDKLMGALQLPKDQESMATVRTIIEPHQGEDLEGYTNRISRELIDLSIRYQQNKDILGSGFKLNEDNIGLGNNKNVSKSIKESTGVEGKIQEVKQIGNQTLIKINNKWYYQE